MKLPLLWPSSISWHLSQGQADPPPPLPPHTLEPLQIVCCRFSCCWNWSAWRRHMPQSAVLSCAFTTLTSVATRQHRVILVLPTCFPPTPRLSLRKSEIWKPAYITQTAAHFYNVLCFFRKGDSRAQKCFPLCLWELTRRGLCRHMPDMCFSSNTPKNPNGTQLQDLFSVWLCRVAKSSRYFLSRQRTGIWPAGSRSVSPPLPYSSLLHLTLQRKNEMLRVGLKGYLV